MTGTNDYSYQGAQDIGSTGNQYNTHQFQIDQTNVQNRTKTPVKVITAPYDASGNPITPGSAVAIGFIDVQPLVNQVDGFGNATPHGTVFRIPYHRYQSGNGAFISDPVVGDIGDYIVDDRDTSVVYATSAQANPGSGLGASLSNGTYHGQTRGGAPGQFFAWLGKGFNITDAFGNTVVGTASGVLINGCLINQSGDVITKAGTNVDTHVHTGVTAGDADTGPPAT